MNRRFQFGIGGVVACVATVALAQYGNVQNTLHNLSVSGPGDVRSMTETQVCKFCHIPHSAVVNEPLWGQQLSSEHYETARVRSNGERTPAPQPDGASRLCLSCHDGTVAVGDIGRNARRGLPSGRGVIGTDLSGSHPVSIVVRDSDESEVRGRDMGIRPLAAIGNDRDVRLDAEGKIQCTTCHDPHVDRYYKADETPHFFVKPTVTEVCVTCHELR